MKNTFRSGLNDDFKKLSNDINFDNLIWGFIDKDGKVIINPQFFAVGFFSDEKCAVMNNEGKWGYINKDGKIEINYQFEKASSFVDGYAIVGFDDKFGVIDKEGKYLINPQFDEMSIDGDNFLIEQNDKFGWCDKDGKIIINPQFDEACLFNGNKLAAVELNDAWGYIDEEGKIIINNQFDKAFVFNGGLAFVESSDKVGVIDEEGKYLINPQFDDISSDLSTYLIFGKSEYNTVYTEYIKDKEETEEQVEAVDDTEFEDPMVDLDYAEEFYIINVMAVNSEQKAKKEVIKLKGQGYESDYLWIPDYESLSNAEYYSVYIGPFNTLSECEIATEAYRKKNSGAYGLRVAHDNKRVEIRGIGKVKTMIL